MRGWIKQATELYYNFITSKTDKPVIVIESDDWGSLRTKNKRTRALLNEISPSVRNDRYTQLDSLANVDDLNALFETLHSVRDRKGNPAKLTANVCVANPDFERIKKDKFDIFHYENFNTTIKRHNHGKEIWNLWEDGIKNKMFHPQLHGREHVHALQWLAELRAGNKDLLKAFELESFGIPYQPVLNKRRKNLQAALDIYGLNDEDEFQNNWIKESADIFEKVFGFRSTTFIPPAYTWHSKINDILHDSGVKALQGIKLQYQPKGAGYRRKFHYTGQHKNKLRYIIRNVFFEPASAPEKDWVDITLSGIERAFS